MWRQKLLEEIKKLKGAEAARHFDMVLLPSLLGDFMKVLSQGRTREDYNIDNGITVTFVGKKPAQITEVYLNGQKIYQIK